MLWYFNVDFNEHDLCAQTTTTGTVPGERDPVAG
jgi:hypothetical protein